MNCCQVYLNFNLRPYDAASVVRMFQEVGASEFRLIEHSGQGLTLVHVFAHPERFLSLKPTKHPITWDKRCSR